MLKTAPLFPNNNLFDNFGVAYHFYDKTYTYKHTHVYTWECFIITKGTVIHNLNGKQTVLNKNCMCLLRPHDEHFFTEYNGIKSEHLSISIRNELLSELLNAIALGLYDDFLLNTHDLHVTLSETQLRDVTESIDFLQKTPPNTGIISTSLKFILAKLVNIIYTKFYVSASHILPQKIQTAIDIMKNTQNFDISISDICRQVNYSHSYFLSYFKKHTGKTIIEYFNEIKLDYAYNLISTTNYTILFIANNAGFSSISYFNKEFKNKYSITPSQLRYSLGAKA